MSALGHNRERQVKALLEGQDWFVTRAAGSLGDADLVAAKAYSPPYVVSSGAPPVYGRLLLIEVKATADGPYKTFSPKDRADLIFAARLAGAEAWLCWWRPRGEPVWIPEHEWPKSKGEGDDA